MLYIINAKHVLPWNRESVALSPEQAVARLRLTAELNERISDQKKKIGSEILVSNLSGKFFVER